MSVPFLKRVVANKCRNLVAPSISILSAFFILAKKLLGASVDTYERLFFLEKKF